MVDYGSHTTKIGFAGEDCPRIARRTRESFEREALNGIAEISIGIDIGDHPIIATTPTFLSDKERRSRTEVLFQAGAPAVYLVRSAVAAGFATGRSTALVIEAGASGATICPVFDGYSLLRCAKQSEQCSGEFLSKKVAEKIKGSLPVPKDPVKLYAYWDRVDDIKHSCCKVFRGLYFNESYVDDQSDYFLPDGKQVKLGKIDTVCVKSYFLVIWA